MPGSGWWRLQAVAAGCHPARYGTCLAAGYGIVISLNRGLATGVRRARPAHWSATGARKERNASMSTPVGEIDPTMSFVVDLLCAGIDPTARYT